MQNLKFVGGEEGLVKYILVKSWFVLYITVLFSIYYYFNKHYEN